MPDIGDRSPHDCPDCGLPMYWTEDAVRGPDLLARTARGAAVTSAGIDAYRCTRGHTSQECPLCGRFDTAAWRDGGAPRYHVICGACGHDSVSEGLPLDG